jgi:hypothetical protein
MNAAHAEHLAHNAGHRVASTLTPVLHAYARQNGWDDKTIAHLQVRHDRGQFHVWYPDEAKDQVHKAEMGDINTPPAPAIRQFMNRLEEHAGQHHADSVLSSLSVAGWI